MKDDRNQAYIELIEELLSCPSGEEVQVLENHEELIDAGFVQMMGQVAEMLREEGNQETANYLIYGASQLAERLELSYSNSFTVETVDSQLDLLFQLLDVTLNSGGNKPDVYLLMQENLDQLDDKFVTVLDRWAFPRLQEANQEEAEIIAATLVVLSNCFAQFPLGSRAINLEIAITGHKIANNVYTSYLAGSDLWGNAQVNLGTAYLYRIRGNKAENLEFAIWYYEAAFEVLNSQDFPKEWTVAQTNMGIAYTHRIKGDTAENLEIAIRCFLSALEVRTRQAFPENWANTKLNLASAYVVRLRGERSENLEEAIRCLEASLEVYTRQDFSEEWAKAQVNLAEVYRNRIRGERAQNLEAAIRCILAAMEVHTRDAFPEEWAMTQFNLGTIYVDRIRGNKIDNWELSIRCYEAALQVFTPQAFPSQWAETTTNMGNAYVCLRGEKVNNLDKAITCYEAALEVYTRQDFPFKWAQIKINMGCGYFHRFQGKSVDDLESAIRCQLAALEVYTRQDFPQKWATAKINLAGDYIGRILVGEKTKNLELAIGCLQDVLEVWTRESFPENYIRSQLGLGHAYENGKQFSKAYSAYATAIDTVELLRREIISGSKVEVDKQKLAEQWHFIYERMVEVCLELGDYRQAIEYVERSKGRNLVELLITQSLYPKGDIPKSILNKLDRLRRDIAAEQQQIDIGKGNSMSEGMLIDGEILSRVNIIQNKREYVLQKLWQELDNLIDIEIQPLDPTFSLTQRVEHLSFQQIQELLPDDKTALIEFYCTLKTIYIFIVLSQNENPIVMSSSSDNYQTLVNWMDAYWSAYTQQKDQWKTDLASYFQQLAEILQLDRVVTLVPPECNQLILIPHIMLHLFPLHAFPLFWWAMPATGVSETMTTLLDRFKRGVRYAPSCQLLQLAQTRQRPDFTQLFAVENPTEDLTYATLEVEAIKGYFHQLADIIKKRDATKAAIAGKNLKDVHCFHFSGHGYFNLDNPRKSALIPADAYLDPPPEQLDPERHLRLHNGTVLDLEKCLTLDAILTLNLEKCRLVTLSACETGLIDFQNTSDEYIGITNVFLVAGTPAVIISLWEVNAVSTAFLMIEFYHNLHAGLTVAEALNKAQLWLRDVTKVELEQWISDKQLRLSRKQRAKLEQLSIELSPKDKPFQQPYYWAGFCAVGQ